MSSFESPEFLIDPIWPVAGDVHLVGGASGSGKTTLLFQILDKWRRGEPWLDMPCHPKPFAYVTIDRTVATTAETLKRVGINPASFPMTQANIERPDYSNPNDNRTERLIKKTREEFPDAKVLVIDGFGFLCPHGKTNDYLVVGEWLQRIGRYCTTEGITIIGVVHTPKTRKGEEIVDPRQRILGSVAAGAIAGSIIMIDQVDADKEHASRKLSIFPRNSRPRFEHMEMNDKGLLVPDSVIDADNDLYLRDKILEIPTGTPLTRSMIEAFGEQVKMSRATITRKIGDLCRDGILKRGDSRGVYTRPLIEIPGETSPWEKEKE